MKNYEFTRYRIRNSQKSAALDIYYSVQVYIAEEPQSSTVRCAIYR